MKYHTQVCLLYHCLTQILLYYWYLSPLYSLHHTLLCDLSCVLCFIITMTLIYSQFIVLLSLSLCTVCVHSQTVRPH